MKLQICRNRLNFEAAGMLLVSFFIPAVWQDYTKHSSFFLNPVGWLCMVMTKNKARFEKAE
ncbi:MAG TPA: hypothetical protein VGY56_09125, partial [Verrucomicrobiae bacterium]|nr:hypothetical protein [Verrucomicrobiae bacterium]